MPLNFVQLDADADKTSVLLQTRYQKVSRALFSDKETLTGQH